jgi:peptide deformylase
MRQALQNFTGARPGAKIGNTDKLLIVNTGTTRINMDTDKIITDRIVTDLHILQIKSKPTSIEEIAKLDLKNRLAAACQTGWVKGYGLAAIQIGLPLCYAWYQIPGQKAVELINPKIISKNRYGLHEKEGCLSIPYTRIDTIRFNEITFENNGQTFSATGLEAFIIQHEVDHINGLTIYNRAQNPFPKLGRNDPCGCGSGKKYKRCCLL